MSARWAWASVCAALVIVSASIAVPRMTGTDVRVHWPPLHADVRTSIPPYLAIVAVFGLVLALAAPAVIDRLRWPQAVAVTTAMSWVWTMALALSEGTAGLSRVFSRQGEYLYDAHRAGDISTMLAGFIDRIPRDTTDHWHTHVAGHPPGALLSFVFLDRVGVSSPFWVGVVVVTIGATAVTAIMLTLNQLAHEAPARQAGLWIALAPVAVWAGVSADWYFAAIAAWGLFLLTWSAQHRSVAAGIAAGLLLGWCVFLSYGLVLLAIPAVAIIWVTSGWRLVPWVLAGGLAVTAAFWASGFAWWDAFPVLRERYYAGIARDRPYGYWIWANLGAWTFTLGLATWAAFPELVRLARRRLAAPRVVVSLILAVGVATVSGMSKAEVERIWIPFTVWVLAAGALLPLRWRRPLLASQVVTAVAVQALLLTRW
jgi:hypothetical protein